MPLSFAFARTPFAAALIAGGLVALSTPAAHAQFFNFLFHEGLDPSDVQSMLEDRGLNLTGPLRRNGGVYIADVEGPRGVRQRLIVDAESGRVVQRFRLSGPRLYSEYGAPRPPGEMGEAEQNPYAFSPPAVVTYGQSVARGEDATSPNIVSVPGTTNEENAKPRAKPQARHKKIELTPVAPVSPQPAQSASSPAPEAKQPVHAEATSGAGSKAAPAPAPAPAAQPAPAAKAKPSPAVNDVPVTPLD